MSELDHDLQAQIAKLTDADGLVARIDELIESHRKEALLSTTGAPGAIGELARRNEGLEQAVRALALSASGRKPHRDRPLKAAGVEHWSNDGGGI